MSSLNLLHHYQNIITWWSFIALLRESIKTIEVIIEKIIPAMVKLYL